MNPKLFNRINLYSGLWKCSFIILLFGVLGISTAFAQYPIRVNVQVTPPISPYLPQLLGELKQGAAGSMTRDITDRLHITLTNTGTTPKNIKLSSKIERLSPAPMSIGLRPGFTPSRPVTMNPGQMIQADRQLLNQAFGGFNKNDLIFNNISLSQLRENGVNYKLPEGTYRICVSAYDFGKTGMTGPLSAPGTGCATFMICYSASAPQLITPVTSMLQSYEGFQNFTPHSSQIQFTWTPPTSTCGLPIGALTYDLIIRRVFPGQTLKDALFNPPVFQKQDIHTNTFLLDTLRYPHVLTRGAQYAIRIKANFNALPGSPLEIDNRGYSRVAGMNYSPVEENKLAFEEDNKDATAKDSTETRKYAGTSVKGKLLWAFRQSEEDEIGEQISIAGISGVHKAETSSSGSTSPVVYYMGDLALNHTKANALEMVDPTLTPIQQSAIPTNSSNQIAIEGEEAEQYLSETMISSNAASSINYEDKTASTKRAQQKYPLKGATIQLKMVKTSIVRNLSPDVAEKVRQAAEPKVDREFFGGRSPESWGDIISGSTGLPSGGQPGLPGNVPTGLPDGNQPNLPGGGVDLPGSGQPGGLPSGGFPGQMPGDIDLPGGPSPAPFGYSIGPSNSFTEAPIEVTIKKSWKTIATATTGEDGSFVLNSIDPNYMERAVAEGFLLTVDKPGFYHFSYQIPAESIDTSKKEVNLGELVMLANTFRFTASVKDVMQSIKGKPIENLRVDIFRKAEDVSQLPFLENEGKFGGNENRIKKTINGVDYLLVATDSTAGKNGDRLTFDFGKLFAYDVLHVEVSSTERNLLPLTTNLRVSSSTLEEEKIVRVTANYELPFSPPSVEGNVALLSGDNEVSKPIRGALVRVTFNPDDVLNEVRRKRNKIAVQLDNKVNFYHTPTSFNTLGESEAQPELQLASLDSQPDDIGSGYTMPMMLSASSNIGEGYQIQEVQVTGMQENDVVSDMFSSGYFGPYTVATDESGYFYVGELPLLREGAKYTVTLLSVPQEFDNLDITSPEGGEEEVEMRKGVTSFVQFNLNGEVTPIVGRIVDEDGQPLSYAKLHFEGSKEFFETNNSGAFQTKYFTGNHTLVIEKDGYVTKTGEVHIGEEEITVNPPLVQNEGQGITAQMYSYPSDVKLNAENRGAFYQLVSATPSGKYLLNMTEEQHNPPVTKQKKNGKFNLVYPGGNLAQLTSAPQFSEMANPFTASGLFATGVMDVGDIGYLEKKRAKVKFVVKDADDHSKLLKDVQIALFDTTHTTNENGEWKYEGLGGQVTVTLIPANSSGYVSVQFMIELPNATEWVTKELFLEKGIRLYGAVTEQNNGQPIDSVSVTIDGQDFAPVLTDEEGNYEMYVSKEMSHEINASKMGYVSGSASKDFGTEEVNVNFQLKDGGGKNINTLLGFNILLDSIVENSDGSQVWSGRFVRLKPYLPVLETEPRIVLPFNNIHVTFPDGVNAVPDGDSVLTASRYIPLKLFTYIPLRLESRTSERIVVKKSVKGDWGSISGMIKFDPARILGSRNRRYLNRFTPMVVPDALSDAETPGSIEFFLGEGATGLPSFGEENEDAIRGWITEQATDLADDLAPGAVEDARAQIEHAKEQLQNLKFRFESLVNEYDTVSIELYGFSALLDLKHSSISNTGIFFAGKVHTPQIGPVAPMDIPLEELTLNPSFDIDRLEVDPKDLPTIEFGDVLKARLSELVLTENGITTSGVAAITLPYSETSYLKLKDLKLTSNGISGGDFKFNLDGIGKEIIDSLKAEAEAKGKEIRQTAEGLLQQGIDLFSVATINGNGTSLGFGQLSGTGEYFLRGSVDMKFTKWIDNEVKINNFMISTDGDFKINIPADYSADLEFASYAINTMDIAYNNQVPFVRLNGKLNIDIPAVSLEASNMTFMAQENGIPDISIDSIRATVDVPGVKCEALVGILDNGFSGDGSFELKGTEYGAAIGFHYYNDINGLNLGARFAVGASIPIGIVTIGQLGGGFTYKEDYHTDQFKFMATIKGNASISGFDKAVKLDSINLSVEAGSGSYPVVTGSANVKVANSLKLAELNMLMDFNRELFTLDVNATTKPLEGVAEVNLNGTIQLAWGNSPYLFLGTAADISLGDGFMTGAGEFALGLNVTSGLRKNPTLGIMNYFKHTDEELLPKESTFSGVYVYAGAKVGSKTKDAFSGDIGIASAHVRFYAAADAMLFLNFADDRYHASLGGELFFMANAEVLGMNVIDAEAGACFRIAGGRSDAKGWYFNGKAAAYFKIAILNAPDGCNSINYYQDVWSLGIPIPVGGRACGYGYATIDYSQTYGLDLGGGMGVPDNNTSIGCAVN